MENFPRSDWESEAGDQERLEAVRRVKEYLAEEQVKISAELEVLQKDEAPENKVSVSSDLRIVPPPSRYLEKDRQFVKETLSRNYDASDASDSESEKYLKEGFQFELLKTAIMLKYAGGRFMTLRSSQYDDIANGVDNVLVDRTTGEPVCALDEVASQKITGDERYEKKVDKILRSNLGLSEKSGREKSPRERFGPGAHLQYGVHIQDDKLECKPMNNLPLFLLSIDREHLAEGLKNFNPEGEDEYSKKMYKYFLSAMNYQIDRMNLFERKFAALPNDMRKRIQNFKSFLDQETKPR